MEIIIAKVQKFAFFRQKIVKTFPRSGNPEYLPKKGHFLAWHPSVKTSCQYPKTMRINVSFFEIQTNSKVQIWTALIADLPRDSFKFWLHFRAQTTGYRWSNDSRIPRNQIISSLLPPMEISTPESLSTPIDEFRWFWEIIQNMGVESASLWPKRESKVFFNF